MYTITSFQHTHLHVINGNVWYILIFSCFINLLMRSFNVRLHFFKCVFVYLVRLAVFPRPGTPGQLKAASRNLAKNLAESKLQD